MPYFMIGNYRHRPHIDQDRFWNEKWGSIVDNFIHPINRGDLVDSKYFPKSGRLQNRIKHIPPFFNIQYWYCNEMIKDAIERLEPGRHRFHPFSLLNRSGKTELAKLYIINVLEPVNALDVENSDGLIIHIRESGSRFVQCDVLNLDKNQRQLVLHNHMIEGKHLWHGEGAKGPGQAYVSDELHDIIKEQLVRRSTVDFYRTK